jgi:hypothetical protein
MKNLIEAISKKILHLFKNNAASWHTAFYEITATPSLNVSYSAGPKFLDSNGKNIEIQDKLIYIPDDELNGMIINLFRAQNENGKINRAIFYFENNDFAKANFEWMQSVQDQFEQYLPKSKKGKVKAWYTK